jgi:signal transduction histidine kinase/predicted RNA-binding protein with RPS1 domain
MSSPTFLLHKYPRYSKVSGKVVKHTDRGTTLLLADGVQGYIPRRELAWGKAEDLQEGQRLEAIVLKEDHEMRRLVLSRRLALKNPWDTALEDYPVGSIRRGRITQITKDGAYVDLGFGIDGLVHVSEFPKRASSIELWPDDQVLVKVLNVDIHRHLLSLSIKAPTAERGKELQLSLYSERSQGTPLWELVGYRIDPLEDLDLPSYDPDGPVRQILLLDNDTVFASNTVAWMRDLGYEADQVETVEQCLDWVERNHYDLLLLDYKLDQGTGLEIAQRIRSRGIDTPIVLLSGQAEQRLCTGHQVEGLICWTKPFGMEDFVELLKAVQEGVCRICSQVERGKGSSFDIRVELDLESESSALLPLELLAKETLKALVDEVGAEAGLVCAIDVGSNQVSILARMGSIIDPGRADLHQLLNSPVADVCLRKETIRVDDVSHQHGRFRYLLPLGTFSAFLGLPVPVSQGDVGLGILLFHSVAGHFTYLLAQKAIIRAGFLALKVERQDVIQSTLVAQQSILAGRLASVMAHEVRGQIGQLRSISSFLVGRLRGLSISDAPFGYEKLVDEKIVENVKAVGESSASISRIIESQLEFARTRDRYVPEELDLKQLIDQMVAMLKLVARGMLDEAKTLNSENLSKVDIVPKIEGTLPPLLTVPLLIKQIFLNLTFNAIQQIIEANISTGLVKVWAKYEPVRPLPVRILFEDTGPGIHTFHQRQLFRRGFSTRKTGTGQGLYISRAIASALGGELHLNESFIGYGSTFELALPIDIKERSNE